MIQQCLSSFVDTINYKIAYQLYLLIKKKSNHNHLIIFGINHSGKTTLIQLLFKDIYNGDPYPLNNKNFEVLIHPNYYIFNCNIITNKSEFVEYLKSITQTYDYYNNTVKYIILTHFESINEIIQNSIRVIIEKSSLVCKFIIVTNNYNKGPDLTIQSDKNQIRELIYQKGKFDLNKDILEKIQKNEFNNNKFNELASKNVEFISINSIKDNNKFEENSVKMIYSLGVNSFTLASDNEKKLRNISMLMQYIFIILLIRER